MFAFCSPPYLLYTNIQLIYALHSTGYLPVIQINFLFFLSFCFLRAAVLAFAHLAQISKISDKIRLAAELSNVDSSQLVDCIKPMQLREREQKRVGKRRERQNSSWGRVTWAKPPAKSN